jgi:glycosyltransferase involved in cell wall biosynthesis
VPTVVELHAMSSVRRAPDRLALGLLRRARGYRGIVAISGPLADDLVDELGVARAEILVAADGVRVTDTAVGADGTSVRRPATGRPSVGYTGSLYPGKGAETVVALAERCPWADFHLAGGPEPRAQELRAAAARTPNLTVHGLLAQPETLALQAACDVLVAPFADTVRSDSGVDIARWTSPLKVFEYLASGRPSVIGDLPALRGIVTDEVDALLVPPGDVDAFAGALERLRDDPALAERLGRAGREAAVARWTWSARAARILDRFAADVRVGGAA